MDEMVLQTFIHYEAAYRNQPVIIRRSYEKSRITLGELLQKVFAVKKSDVISLAVTYREADMDNTVEESVIKQTDDIWNYDLFALILRRKTEDGHYTMGQMHENVLFVKTLQGNYILTCISLGGNDTVKYMRVSVLSPDCSETDDCETLKTKNAPAVISFILSYAEQEKNDCHEIYDEIVQRCQRKQQAEEELDEIEREYVNGMYEFKGYFYIGYGKWLLDKNRYYDAYVNLQRAFHYMLPDLHTSDEDFLETFHDVCNSIGLCLSKQGRNVEAAYFLKQGLPGATLENGHMLALVHARLGNPIAGDEASRWFKNAALMYGGTENWPEMIQKNKLELYQVLSENKPSSGKDITLQVEYDGCIRLGYVLNMYLGITEKNIAPCVFVYDQANECFQSRIEDTEQALHTVLNAEDARDKTFILSCSHAHYKVDKSGEDKSILGVNAPVIITTHGITTSFGKDRIRVDIMMCNYPNNDDKREFVKMNIPVHYTFVLSTLQEIEPLRAESKDVESPLLHAVTLKQRIQFLEAYKLSKWTFDRIQERLEGPDDEERNAGDEGLWYLYFEAAYRTGFSLLELGRNHEAAYYLEIASYSKRSNHVQEYINCLANSRDPMALEVVEEVIEHSPKPEDTDLWEGWEFHMAFLKRRKAYILIDRQRYDEAKQLLTEMLDDPRSSEYAAGELKYVESLMNGK